MDYLEKNWQYRSEKNLTGEKELEKIKIVKSKYLANIMSCVFLIFLLVRNASCYYNVCYGIPTSLLLGLFGNARVEIPASFFYGFSFIEAKPYCQRVVSK